MLLNDFLKQAQKKRIVFTNGCFDILHRGHVEYLNMAKALGDLLIIGLNSDRSVSELKGPSRPINNQLDRKFLLENLRAVDFVEIFDELTPLNLIKKVKPFALVKGGDWSVDKIVGHEFVLSYNGLVQSIPFQNGYSTTGVIEKIRT